MQQILQQFALLSFEEQTYLLKLILEEYGKALLPKSQSISLVQKNKPTQKEKLKTVFGKMAKRKMFVGIENPTLWQKKLRDEWE